MTDQFKYDVPLSREISIGNLHMGGKRPVVVQSMTSTDTNDIVASVEQCLRIIEAGGEMIRLTTQGKREVESIEQIIEELDPTTKCIPIVADVHFSAAVAEFAAEVCQKVRINPGNYTERGTVDQDISEEAYEAGENLNKQAFKALLEKCKKHNTALRIGVNHGSLSKRIMSKYGDSPAGMVESAMEFLRVCREADFEKVVVSLKSSNTRVMVQSVRLMVSEMLHEKLYFPIHLGVTEAGDALEGRMRSVVGMAPLLVDGIGNTIRVSLTEAPEKEIPVAMAIRTLFAKPQQLPYHPFKDMPWNPFQYNKPETKYIHGVGGSSVPVVWASRDVSNGLFKPDAVKDLNSLSSELLLVQLSDDPSRLGTMKDEKVIILDIQDATIQNVKHWFSKYYRSFPVNPVVIYKRYTENEPNNFALLAGGELGSLLIDGLIDGVWIDHPSLEQSYITEVVFSILQASRARISSTEFIACPSCGRTLFDIQTVLGKVKKATKHLTGLKIAVMGCIVNGPGEMSDADYGYVGAGKGKVSLYKAGKVEKKNIPADSALDELISLIKDHGDWIDN